MTTTLTGVLIDRALDDIEAQRAQHTAAVLRRVNEGPLVKPFINPASHEARLLREGKIRQLMSTKRQLQSQINEVNDRIALLEAQP